MNERAAPESCSGGAFGLGYFFARSLRAGGLPFDTQFVKAVYTIVVGKALDAAELAYQVGLIDSVSTTRGSLALMAAVPELVADLVILAGLGPQGWLHPSPAADRFSAASASHPPTSVDFLSGGCGQQDANDCGTGAGPEA